MPSALDGLCIIRMQGRVPSGNVVEMTCHAQQATGSPSTQAGLQGLADSVAAWWGDAAQLALYSNGCFLDQVAVQDLSATAWATSFALLGDAGTRGAGAPVSSQDSLVVTKDTGRSGVQFRGRFYTWGALAADLDAAGGVWDTAFATAWEGAIGDLITAISTASPVEYNPVIWHKNGYGDPVGNVDTRTFITGATGRIGLAVQRSRRD